MKTTAKLWHGRPRTIPAEPRHDTVLVLALLVIDVIVVTVAASRILPA